MNYLKEVRAFCIWLEDNQHLTPSARLLWRSLLDINNACGWKNVFTATSGELERLTGYTRPTIIAAKKELEENKLIACTDKWRGRMIGYKMKSLEKLVEKTTEKTSEKSSEKAETMLNNFTIDEQKSENLLSNNFTNNVKNFDNDCKAILQTMSNNFTLHKQHKQHKQHKRTRESKKLKLKKPTLEEVVEYVHTKSLNVDPQFFYEFYNEAEWIDSRGNAVKNWKQKAISWHKHSRGNTTAKGQQPNNRQQAINAVDELMAQYSQCE